MKTTLINGIYVLWLYILLSLMASCLGSNDYNELYSITDAELVFFGLYENDSLPELEKVVFTIDQRGPVGLIYNYDSMAFLTELPEKVFITYVSGSGMDNLLNITDGDSIWLKTGDSIDISKPLSLKVYALDGITTKLYTAQLNIHQVDPDSVQFSRVASELPFLQTEDTKTVVFNDYFLTYSKTGGQIQLHSSQDAVNWTQETVSGLPANAVIKGIQSNGVRLFAYTEDGELYVRYDLSIDQWIVVNKPASIKVKSILGYLNAGPKQPEGLSLVVEANGINTFAFTEDLVHWEYDSISPIPIPDNFPLYDFSSYSYELMLTGRITIFGGISSDGTLLNTVWSTENGRYWAKLSGEMNTFPPLEGANVFYYNNEFWLINGKSEGYFNMFIYYSRDGGVTWQVKAEEKYSTPEEYIPRYNASLVPDKENKYFYIIGGIHDGILPEVWKGFLNKMEFEH